MPEKLTCNPTNLFGSAIRRKCIPHPPTYKLPPVQTVLSSRDKFSEFYPRQRQSDTPLATIYRIYVAILGGRHLALRNEVEYFWNQRQWRVCDIPEPPLSIVTDREQRAVLATIPYLLVKAFNRLINRGLPRDAPAIIHDELMARLKLRPKVFEKVPKWAESVQPLDKPLVIPDSRGAAPKGPGDSDVDSEMRRKNILVFTLPVLFV
ncbi:hypothetical protein GJ744_005507 [Endocarpon pusillum]|uniref:Uncharacterized protein n=1 Tax=Endocarpon pusillum TaxID=364733 RepID=A0A8H7APR3_9EURO|nr:hypothetical protein GJ744_005507 [Endocarpon pusillum]